MTNKDKLKKYNLAIKAWQYLTDHPEIGNKHSFPVELQKRIDKCINNCPLCQIYLKNFSCVGCPLNIKNKKFSNYGILNAPCERTKHPYFRWNMTYYIITRKRNALKIVVIITEARDKLLKEITNDNQKT
jgi:hypothetical protein